MTTATDRLAEIEGRAEAADAALGIGTEPVPYVLIESVTDIPALMRALRAVLESCDMFSPYDNDARGFDRGVMCVVKDIRTAITAALSSSEAGK